MKMFSTYKAPEIYEQIYKRGSYTMIKLFTKYSSIFFITIAFVATICCKTFANERVVLQLSWKHQFQFAGYYAAIEKGYYSDAGFNVIIKEADTSLLVLNEILNGNADYAIGDAELLVSFIEGAPISVIACIYQHSPSVLMVKASSDILTPHDLVGKKLMVGENLYALEILTMLYSEGVNPSQIELVPHNFSVNDLLTDKVDGLGAYISNEPYFMEKFGIPYRLIKPTSYGIDFYSDCLFTSQNKIKRNPEKVLKFQQASIKGWEYALANPEEISKLIIQKYNPSKTMDHLLYEASEIRKLISPDFIEIGHINKWRWQKIGEYLFQQNIATNLPDIEPFIYSPNVSNKYLWIKVVVITLASILLLILILFLLHKWFNLSLDKKTSNYKTLVGRLEEQYSEINRINLELIKSKEQTAELEKNRFFFIRKIVNELRTPANTITHLSEQLSKPNISSEKRKAICSRIVSNSQIVSAFTNDIIAITEVKEKSGEAQYCAVSIESIFESLISKYRVEHKYSSQVSFTTHYSNNTDNKQLVVLNLPKLQQVITKLVENSLKFTEVGAIELGFEVNSPTSLLLWVKDSGIGIKADTVKKINDFFDSSTHHNSSCIGLGLWVCKSLVHQMRGNIWVESNVTMKNESSGSKFFVSIPCTYIEHTTSDGDTTIKPQPDRTNNILVFDNRINDYNYIRIHLKNSGHNLLYTDSLDEAAEIVYNYKEIDILLISMEDEKLLKDLSIQKLVQNPKGIPSIAYATHNLMDKNIYTNFGFSSFIQFPSVNLNLAEHINYHIREKASSS
ncbi:MAG TPA: ABC transporter substrate-binding protein [Tenuifilaceae bacterium]|nr:ABC transporter substrate-binding protein [Tenuifilaceae bacterium]